jgi:hypothetical protein
MWVQQFQRAGETGFIYLRASWELIKWQPNLAATGQVPKEQIRLVFLPGRIITEGCPGTCEVESAFDLSNGLWFSTTLEKHPENEVELH